MILEHIHSPRDVRSLDELELHILCDELRSFLVEQVSHTGGHLASTLGVVELTVAIHRVFDTERDRLVFDVGHQCYVHKILTGRAEQFPTLRQLGGISGFPKPGESVHDAFIAGHASNSVSVALGMARARTMLGQSYHVLSLIGDGALTGGLAYEGLNNAGASGEPLIVILNDNGMSIDRNVGAMSEHLSHLRTKPEYFAFKKAYHNALGRTKLGRSLYEFNHTLKTGLKKAMLPNATMFEDMGFAYLGPVDGHDLTQLTNTLEWAKEMKQPVLVHVRTQKGHGYVPAEREPWRFHGVGPFDAATGRAPEAKESFSTVFGKALTELAVEDPRVCAITAAMEDGTGLTPFAERFPDRFFDVGIAEGHAAAMAAGLAKQGAVPVFAVYSSFLQRAYDQLLHDVALSGLHVVFAVDRAGLVGADGATHQGVFDLSYLRSMPNMIVAAPRDGRELKRMIALSTQVSEPMAIRYPKDCEDMGPGIQSHTEPVVGKGELLSTGEVMIFAVGRMVQNAMLAVIELMGKGVSAGVVDARFVKPLDEKLILDQAKRAKLVVTVEENSLCGGFGEGVLHLLNDRGIKTECMLLGVPDRFIGHGTIQEQMIECGLDAYGIARSILNRLNERKSR